MKTHRNIPFVGLLAFVLMLTSISAAAADRKYRRPEVDIDSLKGELLRAKRGWELAVRFDVEVEDYRPADRFELILYVSEKGYPLADDKGRRIEYVIPLDRPTDVDDDELEFEHRVTLSVPDAVFGSPKRLRLHGRVVLQGEQHPLARKNKSIKFKRHRRKRHRSVRVGAPGDAKVDDLHLAFSVHQDIAGLEIAVDNAVLVAVLNGVTHLDKESHSLPRA